MFCLYTNPALGEGRRDPSLQCGVRMFVLQEGLSLEWCAMLCISLTQSGLVSLWVSTQLAQGSIGGSAGLEAAAGSGGGGGRWREGTTRLVSISAFNVKQPGQAWTTNTTNYNINIISLL